MSAILLEIIALLTSGLVEFGTAIGSALSSMVSSIFLTGTGDAQTLSTFGGLVIIFAGIALCIGLSRFIVNWLTSLGN